MPDEECIFCAIAHNRIPSKKIYEDGDVLAILDINPASYGHTLVLPKKHFANIYDVDEQILDKTMKVVKTVADRIKNRLNAEGLNILQNNGRHAGQLVSHMHFHVIPRYNDDGISLHFPRARVSEEDMKNVQEKLRDEEKRPMSTGIGPGW